MSMKLWLSGFDKPSIGLTKDVRFRRLHGGFQKTRYLAAPNQRAICGTIIKFGGFFPTRNTLVFGFGGRPKIAGALQAESSKSMYPKKIGCVLIERNSGSLTNKCGTKLSEGWRNCRSARDADQAKKTNHSCLSMPHYTDRDY